MFDICVFQPEDDLTDPDTAMLDIVTNVQESNIGREVVRMLNKHDDEVVFRFHKTNG